MTNKVKKKDVTPTIAQLDKLKAWTMYQKLFAQRLTDWNSIPDLFPNYDTDGKLGDISPSFDRNNTTVRVDKPTWDNRQPYVLVQYIAADWSHKFFVRSRTVTNVSKFSSGHNDLNTDIIETLTTPPENINPDNIIWVSGGFMKFTNGKYRLSGESSKFKNYIKPKDKLLKKKIDKEIEDLLNTESTTDSNIDETVTMSEQFLSINEIIEKFPELSDRKELLWTLFPSGKVTLLWNWTNGIIFVKDWDSIIKLSRLNIEWDKSFQYENIMQQVFFEGTSDLIISQALMLTRNIDFWTALDLVFSWEELTNLDINTLSSGALIKSWSWSKYKIPNIVTMTNNHIEMERIYWKSLIRLHTEKVLMEKYNISKQDIFNNKKLTDHQLVYKYKGLTHNGITFNGFPELNTYTIIEELYWIKQLNDFKAFKNALDALELEHKDIDHNPSNVMIDERWNWFLIDFGKVGDISNESPYREIYEDYCKDMWIHPDGVIFDNDY